jgi:hypothetical protein
VTKSKQMVQKRIQTRRAAPAQTRQAVSPMGKPSDPSRDRLSTDALIKDLRGSLKGRPSLVAALQRERRNDDRAKTRKLMATGGR